MQANRSGKVIALLMSYVATVLAVPPQINYQGRLLDAGGQPVSATTNVVVRLFDASSGGNQLYSQTNENIEVVNGLYSFDFGNSNLVNVLTNDQVWLETGIGGEAFAPRSRLQAVPYALRASTVDDAGGGSRAATTTTLTAGETIAGDVQPQPVYIDSSDGKIYLCEADNIAKYRFFGFAVSGGTVGSGIMVQYTGIVDGFTGLTPGGFHYVGNTAGSIGSTPGSKQIQVGQAVSSSSLLIEKAPLYAVLTGSIGSSATITHTIGFRPASIIAHAMENPGVTSNPDDLKWNSHGSWTTGSQGGIYKGFADGGGSTKYRASTHSSLILVDMRFAGNPDRTQASVGTVNDTGFSLVIDEYYAPIIYTLFVEGY